MGRKNDNVRSLFREPFILEDATQSYMHKIYINMAFDYSAHVFAAQCSQHYRRSRTPLVVIVSVM